MSTHDLDAFGCRRPPIPARVATALTYVGDDRARGETIRLAASLTTADGVPVPDVSLLFEIAGQTIAAVTGADGVGAATATVPDHGREQQVIVRFAGDDRHLPSETSALIRWGGGPAGSTP
jgi:hypothetical protein